MIVIDMNNCFFYLVGENGQVWCYGVGVGKFGFEWVGKYKIICKVEWLDWILLKEMIWCEVKKGYILSVYMEGGEENLLGVCVMYFGFIEYCIYGMNVFWIIGYVVFFGCICLCNEDVVDFYGCVKVGQIVIVK